MQKNITRTLAIGIPGEFVNTNLRRVDALLTKEAVDLGSVVALDADGTIVKSVAGKAKYGVAVTTHQHVANNGPVDEYKPTLEVAAGKEIGFCTMGDVFVTVEFTAKSAPKFGATIYLDKATGKLSTTTSGDAFGTVVLSSNEFDDKATSGVFGVRIG